MSMPLDQRVVCGCRERIQIRRHIQAEGGGLRGGEAKGGRAVDPHSVILLHLRLTPTQPVNISTLNPFFVWLIGGLSPY
jgi:hypothetical protein